MTITEFLVTKSAQTVTGGLIKSLRNKSDKARVHGTLTPILKNTYNTVNVCYSKMEGIRVKCLSQGHNNMLGLSIETATLRLSALTN